MQSVSSRIWTRFAVSISYDDNHYIMGTSTVLDISLPNENRLFLAYALISLKKSDFHKGNLVTFFYVTFMYKKQLDKYIV